MRLRPEQLAEHLTRNLAPIYVVGGEEPLLVTEAADAVRNRARASGYADRHLMHADAGFDWRELAAEVETGSLFGDRKLLEVRLEQPKPGDAGARTFKAIAERPPPDALVLVVINGRLDKQTQNSAWLKALDQAGVVVPIWPVGADAFPKWLSERMQASGLQPDRAAVQRLTEKLEGNLLAAVQEVEKIRLINGPGPVDEALISDAVLFDARYSVAALTERALGGQPEAALRTLYSLRAEGTEVLYVLGSLAREIRLLSDMAQALAAGRSRSQLIQQYGIWKNRRQAVARALERLSAEQLTELLATAHRVDKAVKGRVAADPWDGLRGLVLALAGRPAPLYG